MNIEDFLRLGLKEYSQDELMELYWHKPRGDSPDLVIGGRVPKIPLDHQRGERGFLLCYYLRLVLDVSDMYKDRNVEPPFIEVCPTKERNAGHNNIVQIPLSYIPKPPVRLKALAKI